MFDFKCVFLVDSVHVYNRIDFEEGVELYRHAEATEHHISVAVLGAKRLVGDFKTRGAVDSTVNPGYLQTGRKSLHLTVNHEISACPSLLRTSQEPFIRFTSHLAGVFPGNQGRAVSNLVQFGQVTHSI